VSTQICDKCGKEYGVGVWWLCPHEPLHPVSAGRDSYYDDHVAPPPGPDFRPPRDIDYNPSKGYRITNPGDLNRLMRMNKSEARDMSDKVKDHMKDIRRTQSR
jgi:hypothetical protein